MSLVAEPPSRRVITTGEALALIAAADDQRTEDSKLADVLKEAEADDAEIRMWRWSGLAILFAYAAWFTLQGALIIVGGRERLTSPIFALPSRLIPGWPATWALYEMAGGILLMAGIWVHRSALTAAGLFLIGTWHTTYTIMVYANIAWPIDIMPGRPPSYSPLSDHGFIATGAFVCLWRLWWLRRLKRRRPGHAG